MTVKLTGNFFANARGITFTDGGGITWAFNQTTNSLTGTAGSAGTATTAANLSGGAAGSLPYQTGASTTTFLGAGSNGQLLTISGGLPSWEAVPTWNQNTTGSSASCTGNAATATNVAYSGLTGSVPTWNQNTTGNAATATNVAYTGLTGTVPTWNQNTTGSSASCTGNAATATAAAGLSATLLTGSGGTGKTTAAAAYNALSPMTTTGDMEYDSSAGVAARLAIGATNNVLAVVAGVPTWTNAIAPTWTGYHTFSGTTGSNGAAIVIANAQGSTYGASWEMYNTSAGATNPSKYFRINPAGGLEFINSAYNSIILALSDSGILNIENGMTCLSFGGTLLQAIAPTWTASHTFNPAAGVAIGITTGSGVNGIQLTGVGATTGLAMTGAAATQTAVWSFQQSGQNAWYMISPASSNSIGIYTGGFAASLWDSAGNQTVHGSVTSSGSVVTAPASGTSLTVYGTGAVNSAPTVLITKTSNYSGGTAGYVTPALSAVTNVTNAGDTDDEWTVLGVMNNSSTGVGQDVAGYFQGNKVVSTASPTWALVCEAREEVATNNPATGLVGLEVDNRSNGTDSSGNRIGIDVVCTRYNMSGAATAVTFGVRVGCSTDGAHTTIGHAFHLNAGATATWGLDTSQATVTSGAIRLAQSQAICFDAAGVNQLSYNGTGLNYAVSGTSLVTLNAAGGVVINTAAVAGAYGLVIEGLAAANTYSELAIERAGSTINTQGKGPGLVLYDSTNGNFSGIQQSGGQTEFWQYNGSSWVQILKFSTTGSATFSGKLGWNGAAPPAQVTGFGTPVGGAVVASYNITDAGGANSNTNKCVAEILTIMKAHGMIGA